MGCEGQGSFVEETDVEDLEYGGDSKIAKLQSCIW